MKTCVLCKIERGELKALKFYDDGEFFAVLDINPNTPGMSLVIPKKHYASYAFEMPDDVLERFIVTCKKVAKILEERLSCKRVGMIMEGIGINHAHMKLYPIHGITRKYVTIIHPDRVFFEKYPGYMTSLLGPQAKKSELEKIYKKLIT
jgi:diadenosine tetraphosphate (Ap4A) HIT family hydrolase